jgi:ABC-type lipoprotein export system ATPase subunit/PHP family Zn ribbon phosphoesterase
MIKEVELAKGKCSRFYRVDLHLHSPLSYDWKNEKTANYDPDVKLNRLTSIKDINDGILKAYVDKLIQKKLDLVAITDHMRYSFGLKLAEYARSNNLKLLVLPGVEINVKVDQPLIKDFRVHMLAIFPPDVGDKIERIFPSSIEAESKRTGKEEIACSKLEDITSKVRDNGGICIAAHIYNPSGARYAYTKSAELLLEPLDKTEGQAKDDFYKKVGDAVKPELYKFDGLQVKVATESIHFCDAAGELRVPLILGSDAHHVEKFGDEASIAFVKMGRLDFSCFKEAFQFPDTRIRFKTNIEVCNPPRILGIRIIGKANNERAFFKNLVVGVSDNLTCIIGPRGCGKSALIDAARYTMGYNRTLGQIEKLKNQVVDRQNHTLEESQIEILYQKQDGAIHKIQATYDNREFYNTKIFDSEGNELNISDVETCGDYPLNLYGWNELELLGENPQSQRENLDKFIKELNPLKEENRKLYEELIDNKTHITIQIEQLEKYFVVKPGQHSFLRLKEYEKEFQRINTPEIADKFKDLDEITQKLDFLEDLSKAIAITATTISKFNIIPYEESKKRNASISTWTVDFLKRLGMESLNDEILKQKGVLSGQLKSINDIIEKEKTSLQNSRNGTFKAIRSVIGQEDAISIDLRDTAKKRLDSVREQFTSYGVELKVLEELLAQRQGIISKIKDVKKRIFATRHAEISKIEEKISIVNDQDFSIALKLNQDLDRNRLLSALKDNNVGMNFHGQWKNKKVPNVLVSKLDPFAFVDSILQQDIKQLMHKIRVTDNNVDVEYEIDQGYSKKLIEDNIPFETLGDLGVKKYDKEKLNKLLTLQEIEYDDEFFITLGGKAIQHCSPGQRCSAMLPIVTLTSNAPIIIDQPEDNLDNRLVSRAIFKILAKLKESRQIIVATHNPNIPISGDAEQVIVFNPIGTIKDFGSIDEASIIQNIIELMEGGREAFEKRKKKYRSYLGS